MCSDTNLNALKECVNVSGAGCTERDRVYMYMYSHTCEDVFVAMEGMELAERPITGRNNLLMTGGGNACSRSA